MAGAVWRIIRRDGLAEASVRKVAREAGLSMGSLRHYFGTQSELMAFTLRTVIDRVEARIEALDEEADPRRRAERILAELLPLDAERRAENEVWLAFTAQAMVDPGLLALREEGYQVLRRGCEGLVRGLLTARDVEAQDVELEAERLHALVDGLAVHAAVRWVEGTPERLMAVIARHLDELQAAKVS